MSKKLSKITSFFLLFVLVSCGGGSSKVTIETKEGVETIKDILNKEFDLNKEVYSLNILSKGRTSNELDQITVSFTKNNKDAIWFYSMTMAKLFKPVAKTFTEKNVKMLKLSAFNVDDILKHFNGAVTMIKKETDEFENFRLKSYDIQVDNNSNGIMHSFLLLTDKKNDKTSFYGKRLEGKTFEFQFKINEKENLICSSGLDI